MPGHARGGSEVDSELGEAAQRLDNEPLTLVERFHGHVGPYVVLGYRMGRLAKMRLGVNAFGMSAEVYTNAEPPMSCLLDGVQLGSGCTMGKRNITLHSEGRVETLFTSNDGRGLRIKVTPRVLEMLVPALAHKALFELSEVLMGMPDEELFEASLD